MQGMGWSCLEELVWGDKEHRWVRPGQLFTRGPGTYKVGPSPLAAAHAAPAATVCRRRWQCSDCRAARDDLRHPRARGALRT